MTSQPSQPLTKRPSGQLMPPPPPPKRIKRPATALDEDVYTDTLSHIIARDFFPGLLETHAKQEYLDALESKDKDWITSAKHKLADTLRKPSPGSNTRPIARSSSSTSIPRYSSQGRPNETPRGWQGDTPVSVTSVATASTEHSDHNISEVTNMGLMAFQSKYTSEDNESFNKVLDKQNSARREKHAWIWNNNKIPSARQIAHHKQEVKRITSQGGNPHTKLVKQQEEPSPAIKTDLDARPARPDAWNARPDNSLMFLPSSVEETHETRQQRAELASRAGPKRVLYHNTRLLDVEAAAAAEATRTVPPSPSMSAIKDAIAGNPHLEESELGSAIAGSETPRVNGYAFVDEDEPEPLEDSTDDIVETDWSLLGQADSIPNPFQIGESRKREALHHRLVDRVARNKRAEKAAKTTKTPVTNTPRFASSPRIDFTLRGSTPTAGSNPAHRRMLTPAAQKLLHQVGGNTPRSSSNPKSGSTSGNMWTPTPRKK